MKKAIIIELLSMWRCFDETGYKRIMDIAKEHLTPLEILETMFR